jgi:uncharacterized protein (TIGR02246 family)
MGKGYNAIMFLNQHRAAYVERLVQTATAGPKEDVAAAGQKWPTVFAENNPDAMLPFYAKDAVLWGTLSPTVRSDPGAIKAYFVGAFQALPKATVKFGDQLIRVYGNTAVNTGYYTFSYIKDGETKTLPARYSLTYVKDADDWKIVDHHSSAVPTPPLAADLVHRQVALIVALGGETAALAAKRATATIPIVFAGGADPVRTGTVSSLHHPGGNITGVSAFQIELEPKKLGLLRSCGPMLRRSPYSSIRTLPMPKCK